MPTLMNDAKYFFALLVSLGLFNQVLSLIARELPSNHSRYEDLVLVEKQDEAIHDFLSYMRHDF